MLCGQGQGAEAGGRKMQVGQIGARLWAWGGDWGDGVDVGMREAKVPG